MALNLICYDTLGPAVAHSWMAPSFVPAGGSRRIGDHTGWGTEEASGSRLVRHGQCRFSPQSSSGQRDVGRHEADVWFRFRPVGTLPGE